MFTRENWQEGKSLAVPFLPITAIKGHLCFRCCKPPKNVLKCAACKRAVYCSRQCQQQDWKMVHKEQCKVLKIINQIEMEETASTRTWQLYQEGLVCSVGSVCSR